MAHTLVQTLLVAGCLVALALWARHFPYPSPLIRRLLPPERRWPVRQLREWVETGSAHPGFLAFFLRDPERTPPAEPGLVSPADGTVLDVIATPARTYVVVSLSVWDVHVVRSPLDGTITSITDHGDRFEPDPSDPLRDEPLYFLREKRSPVQKRVRLATAHGDVDVRLVTSYLSRRIELLHGEGAVLARGERLGRMLFGSTGVLELPPGLRVTVAKGERVRAGETIVATVGPAP
jgi:phosphatidylserine decarboxylase